MPDLAPYRNFNFIVEIEGITETGFSDVVIPEARIEVVEYREGGDQVTASRKLPGRVSYGNVVLRRGTDRRLELWNWFKAIREGNLDRRDVVITLLDAERQPVRHWKIVRAWPAAYVTSPLHAQGSDVVIETLELANEGVEVESQP